MKTTINRDSKGELTLTIEGNESPQSVATEYKKIIEVLFPEAVVRAAHVKLPHP
jgi:hypothetical protein